MPARGPTPDFLPARSFTDLMPALSSAMKWNGVSYIGKVARMFWYFLPLVQSPVPFQACSATPMVVMPRSILRSSVRMMFWFGPCVCCVLMLVPIFSLTRLAHTCP